MVTQQLTQTIVNFCTPAQQDTFTMEMLGKKPYKYFYSIYKYCIYKYSSRDSGATYEAVWETKL